MSRRLTLLPLIWLGIGLVPQVSVAAADVVAPVTAVTVYSDRARVLRTARVALRGGTGTRVELPLLPAGVDASSIRVELDASRSPDAEVSRVEIGFVQPSEVKLPSHEAEKLLAELESLDDQLAQLAAEQSAYAAQLRLIGRLLPSANGLGQPTGTLQVPPPRLNPLGWGAVMGWTAQLYDRVQKKQHELSEKQRQIHLSRRVLVEKGQQLGGLLRRGGYRVTATVTGSGSADLLLGYLIGGAHWRPSYDIQFVPSQNRVELKLAGLVKQQTGEDWTDAQLTLSTAVPATATQLPKLLTWKLGERERFIPTPRPQPEYVPPPPRIPPRPPVVDDDPQARVEQRLLAKLGMPQRGPVVDGRFANVRDAEKSRFDQNAQEESPALERDADGIPDAADVVPMQAAPMATPPPPPPPPPGRPEVVMAAPVMQSSELSMQVRVDGKTKAKRYPPTSATGSTVREAEVIGFGLAPPPGYQPVSSQLASESGGYDLVFPALAPETVKSGGGERRVALLSRSFPVEVSRKVMPALAPEAFLIAEIKNPSPEPLPAGAAQLFVGADPAGVAQLKLMAPGEVVPLPLGLDRAIRPARNVQVTTVEKGVFSKDEISEYTVTTELTNPYKVPIQLRLYDQVPLVADKNVEIQLVRSEPPATFDEKTGNLEWRPQLPPGSKLSTKFVYTLKRPKGYRLGQSQY